MTLTKKGKEGVLVLVSIHVLGIRITNGLKPQSFALQPKYKEDPSVEIWLSDPLDCLSSLVCGLNSFPPHSPSPRTTPANDYAYLLQQVMLRLKKQNPPPFESIFPANITLKPSKKKVQKDVDSGENLTSAEKEKKKLLKNSKDQDGEVVELNRLYPPFGLLDFFRQGRGMKGSRSNKRGKFRDSGKNKKEGNKPTTSFQSPPSTSKPLTQLELLQKEQNLREKLRSNAQCLYGILDHTCPFKYSELLVLMSAVLERQRVMSYSTSTILPMVGYLLKSRSLTQTLKATFFSLDRVNNVTIMRHKNHEPFSFSHVYDELVRGVDHGSNNGLHIVETKNEGTHTFHSFEDDEFDAALSNPYVPREKIPGYAIKERNKKKKKNQLESVEEDESLEGEEGEVEYEGQRVIIPPPNAGPFVIAELAGLRPSSSGGSSNSESQEENDDEDNNDNASVVESKEDVALPPVYGIGKINHLSKIRFPYPKPRN